MPLDADILGSALYNKAKAWNDVDITPENLDQARKDFWKSVATEIISHIKSNAKLTIPGTGLIAPSGGGTVTGTSITGTIN